MMKYILYTLFILSISTTYALKTPLNNDYIASKVQFEDIQIREDKASITLTGNGSMTMFTKNGVDKYPKMYLKKGTTITDNSSWNGIFTAFTPITIDINSIQKDMNITPLEVHNAYTIAPQSISPTPSVSFKIVQNDNTAPIYTAIDTGKGLIIDTDYTCYSDKNSLCTMYLPDNTRAVAFVKALNNSCKIPTKLDNGRVLDACKIQCNKGYDYNYTQQMCMPNGDIKQQYVNTNTNTIQKIAMKDMFLKYTKTNKKGIYDSIMIAKNNDKHSMYDIYSTIKTYKK